MRWPGVNFPRDSSMRETNKLLRTTALVIACLSLLVQLSWADSADANDSSCVREPSDGQKVSDRWLAKDKLEHLGVSAFLSGVSYSVFRDFYRNSRESSIGFSVSLSLGAGLGKEFLDLRTPRGRFSFKDLAADLVGISVGLLIATR